MDAQPYGFVWRVGVEAEALVLAGVEAAGVLFCRFGFGGRWRCNNIILSKNIVISMS